jgi:hypothetical protein
MPKIKPQNVVFREPLVCSFCGAEFKTDTGYSLHKCEKMQRREDIKTPTGQTAYGLYSTWFTVKKKNAPSIESFMNSRYFKSFFKFAEFVKRLKITETELYIRMMNDKDILPVHWTSDDMYSHYIEYLDRKLSPKRQAGITIRTMEKIVDAAECDIREVFDVLTGADLIQLIRERKLSPWVLLRSRKFMVKFELLSSEEQHILEGLVRFPYWKQKFESRLVDKTYMDKLVKEMDL